MSVLDDSDREAFGLFPVYCALVTYLRPGYEVLGPTTSPGDLVGQICAYDMRQLAHLIVGHCYHTVPDVDEAQELISDVLEMCKQGRRPRYLLEMKVDDLGGTDAC